MNAEMDAKGQQLDSRLQMIKEGVTAILALAIVGTTLYWMSMAFGLAGDATKMSDAKDLLALMSGLTGVVLGYYFGRVPSEARASQAQLQVVKATQSEDRMKVSMAKMMDELGEMQRSGNISAENFDTLKGMAAAD